MSDEDAFLAAIRAAPSDDAPRLVYADWLDERGQHEQAEAIRVEHAYRRALTRLVELHKTIDFEWANRVFPANGFELRYYPPGQAISVIKLIREFMECGLAEAKGLAELLPSKLGRPILFADLDGWETKFQTLGAHVVRTVVPYRRA